MAGHSLEIVTGVIPAIRLTAASAVQAALRPDRCRLASLNAVRNSGDQIQNRFRSGGWPGLYRLLERGPGCGAVARPDTVASDDLTRIETYAIAAIQSRQRYYMLSTLRIVQKQLRI